MNASGPAPEPVNFNDLFAAEESFSGTPQGHDYQSEEPAPKRRRAALLLLPLFALVGFGLYALSSGGSSDTAFDSGEYFSPADQDGDSGLVLDSSSTTSSLVETSTTSSTTPSTTSPTTTSTVADSSFPPVVTVEDEPTTPVTSLVPVVETTVLQTTTTLAPPTTTTAPPSAPAAPSSGSMAVSVAEEADSSPRVRFTWGSQSAVTDLEYNYYNGSAWSGWSPLATSSTSSGWLDASFGTNYQYQIRARNCNSLCSNWTTSSSASVVVGSPVSAPAAPAAISVSSEEEEDSTPRVRFSWTDRSPSELQAKYNGGSWTSISASSVQTAWIDANFATTYTYQVRARNCSAGNDYNSTDTVCSAWSTSNSDSEAVGSPAPNASTPSTPSINTDGTALNSTYRYQFNWNNVSANEQQCSYNGGSWTACSGTSWSGTAGAGQTKSLNVRVRNTASPNSYGGGADSSWATATERSVTFGSPVPAPGAPAAFTVSGSAGDLSASFSWSVANTQQQISFNGASYVDVASATSSYSVSSPSYSTTYSLTVRARNCATGNAYNTSTPCSGWTSASRSVTTPAPPVPTVSSARRDRDFTGVTGDGVSTYRYEADVTISRNGFSGTVNAQFSSTNCNAYSASGSVFTMTGSDTYQKVSSNSSSSYLANMYNWGSGSVRIWGSGFDFCTDLTSSEIP